jgi:alpha-beta hydrolase superfamily lysophospholipase
MEKNYLEFTAKDKTKIKYLEWKAEDPKLCVEIVHGMHDHAMRYDEFARFLQANGISSYALDLRGHGITAVDKDHLGIVPKNNAWMKMVDDIDMLNSIIRKENPGKKVVLLGHSMGSILARTYAYKYGENIDKMFLLSSVKCPIFLNKLFKVFLKVVISKEGYDAKNESLNQKSFDFMSKNVQEDMLTSDPEERAKFLQDELCIFEYSNGFFQMLIHGVDKATRRENLKYIPKDLPIYLFSGKKDPLSNFELGIKQIYGLLRSVGIEDLKLIEYDNLKHELLHDIEKEKVFQDILKALLA